MEIIFNEEYLREMYNTGRTDKKHRFQPQIIRKYIRVIDLMGDTSNVLGLMRYNALNSRNIPKTGKPLPRYVILQICQTIIND